MNFYIDEREGLREFLSKTCVSVDKQTSRLKEEIGSGYIYTYNICEGLNVYVFDFVLKEPMLIHWKYGPEHSSDYFVFYNITERVINEEHEEDDSIEEGAAIFSGGNHRRRIWLPKVRYNVLYLHFSRQWYDKINATIQFPKQIEENLKHTSDLYLHISIAAQSSLAASQIRSHLIQPLNLSISYLEIKCIELIYLLFSDALKNISTTKTKSSVHPLDLAKLNEFMSELNNTLAEIPDINNAAKLMGMSPSKFQRLFKSIIGNSYYNYVYRLKMDAAMEFLLHGMPVSEVAFKLGYSSIGNFTNAFKRGFGFLPSDMLKKSLE